MNKGNEGSAELIEKSYTEEEIAEIVRRHGLPRYPKLALYREKLSQKAS